MTLYLSNTTKQILGINIRDPRTNLLMTTIRIPAGHQQPIGKEWSREETGKVIDQLRMHWGALDAAEVHRTQPNFAGLVYREDHVVSAEEILLGHDNVKKMQEERSVNQTINSALAADRAANSEPGRRRVKQTEVEVQELPKDGRPTGNEQHFALTVTAEGGSDRIQRKPAA